MPSRTVIAALVGLAFVVSLALLTRPWLERQRSRRALAAHMEQGRTYAARVLERLGSLPPELSESSGLVVSRTQPGVLWTHNDSGDGPILYAIDMSGRLLAVLAIPNAVARDWEDLSYGPCPAVIAVRTGNLCLYVADTGDNDRMRSTLTVYIVIEPLLDRAEQMQQLTASARSFQYRYPNGPDDSEAFAVLPDGEITIVSKGRSGTIDFFRLAGEEVARALGSGEVLTARHSGDTGMKPDAQIGRLVTGAAVSSSGKTLAVRTYNEVFFFGVAADGQASRWRDLSRPCFLGNAEPQGEAIAYLDGETMLLTSESARGIAGMIHRLQC